MPITRNQGRAHLSQSNRPSATLSKTNSSKTPPISARKKPAALSNLPSARSSATGASASRLSVSNPSPINQFKNRPPANSSSTSRSSIPDQSPARELKGRTPSLLSNSSTPKNVPSHEIQLLKQLNAELIQRLKVVEVELRTTKEKLALITDSQRKQPDINSEGQIPLQPCSTARESTNSNTQIDSDPNPKGPRLLLCGDSLTRDLGVILQQLLPQYSVMSLIYPGAPLSYCTDALCKYIETNCFTKNDYIFILGGANDIPFLSPVRLESIFRSLCNLSQSTNIIFSSVPYRFDTAKFNLNIFATNSSILKLCSTYKMYYLECNFFLSRDNFTRHGLHFNMGGKQYLCRIISNFIETFQPNLFILPNFSSSTQGVSDITCPHLIDITLASSESSLNSTFFLEL